MQVMFPYMSLAFIFLEEKIFNLDILKVTQQGFHQLWGAIHMEYNVNRVLCS